MNAAIHLSGWTLVHFLWQGAAIALAAAIALRLLRDASPRPRYALACLALAAMLAAPVATAWRLSSEPAPVPVAEREPLRLRRNLFLKVTPAPVQHDRFLVEGRLRSGDTFTTPGSRSAIAWPLVMPVLVGIWFAGVCLLLVRLAGGWLRIARLQRVARMLPPSRWQAASEALGRRIGVSRHVHVVDAVNVDSPVVVGWLQPVVLLPIAAVAGLTPEQVHAILAHELAHVRRHDALVNFCQTVAETLLFYHPAVWWVSARIRIEREHCCDDIALAATGDAFAFASALAELESHRSAEPRFALAATGGPLLRRVTRLLSPPPSPSRTPRTGVVATLALIVVFVLGAGALQHLVARQPAVAPVVDHAGESAWRMTFDHPSGQMTIRGFTARDLVRYAYQLPVSQVVGGPKWLDTDSFAVTTSVDHVPAADETPDIVRRVLEERFGLRAHESTVDVPVFALEIARPDGVLGPNLQPATAECFDQQAWVAAGAPRLPFGQGERTINCGIWDNGIAHERVRSITMPDFAASMRHRFGPAIRRDVIDRTGLEGRFDVALEYFRPAAAAMSVTPSLRQALRLAGFASTEDALESQLGLKLVPATAPSPAIVIDEIRRPLDVLNQP
jgi:uncharacterized protein (TIGR03435 family)